MKKIVRLSESDMVRLVKKIVKEEKYDFTEKHYEYDTDRGRVFLMGSSSKFVKKVLNNLPPNLTFLAIIDCDFADFDGVDLCYYAMLQAVRLVDTENNFEEQNYECIRGNMGNLILFKDFG
jgi:hypothetical protein